MAQEGICPNLRSYNTVIDACAKSRNLAKAEEWLQTMQEVGVAPDA